MYPAQHRRSLKPLLTAVDAEDDATTREELTALLVRHGVGPVLACELEIVAFALLWLGMYRGVEQPDELAALATDLCARRPNHEQLDEEEAALLLTAVLDQSFEGLDVEEPLIFVLKAAVLVNDCVHLLSDLTGSGPDQVWLRVEAGTLPDVLAGRVAAEQ